VGLDVHYLESIDSVRVVRGAGGGDIAGDLHLLQVFLEAVMTLALGKDIVVPQSYAFDSHAFLVVAENILRARDQAVTGRQERPFRPHLRTEHATFDAAIKDMISRAREGSFHSSLHPVLNSGDDGELAAMAADLDVFTTRIDEDVAAPLDMVRREFRLTRRVPARPLPDPRGLQRLIEAFVDTSRPMRTELRPVKGSLEDTVRERLLAALTRLHADSPTSFGQRSRLRQDTPWNGEPGGPSARDLVEDDDVLALVTEFVDTLYNRVIVEDIGIASATYSTSLTLGPRLERARGLAQRLALGNPTPLPSTDPPDTEIPLFEVRWNPQAVQDDSALVPQVRQMLKQGSSALTPLFEARSEPGDEGRRNEFWRSVRQLEDTARTGDPMRHDAYLRSHLRRVSKLLRGGRGSGSVKEAGKFAMSDGGSAGATQLLLAGGLVEVALTAAGGSLGALALPAFRAGRDRGRQRRFASALGDFVLPAREVP
jgi:hypothetical protein